MSAVIKENHVESIFDYALSNEESFLLTYGMTESEYIEFTSEHDRNMGLAALFGMRGEYTKKQHYVKKLDTEFVKININWDSVQESIR